MSSSWQGRVFFQSRVRHKRVAPRNAWEHAVTHDVKKWFATATASLHCFRRALSHWVLKDLKVMNKFRSRIASTVACKYLQVVWHGLTRTKPFLVPLDSYPNLCAAECPQQMGGEQSFHPQLAACMQNQTWAILLISFCYFSGWSAVRGSSLDRFQLDRLVLCLGSGVPSAYSVGLPVKHDTHCMTLHQSVVKLLSQTEPFFKLLFFPLLSLHSKFQSAENGPLFQLPTERQVSPSCRLAKNYPEAPENRTCHSKFGIKNWNI